MVSQMQTNILSENKFFTRTLQETGIRSNDLKGKSGVQVSARSKVQGKAARNGRVQKSESVLSGLHVEEGPGLSVDVNHVAPGTLTFIRSRLKGTVLVVELGREDQGNVVFAVPRRQTESVFSFIGDNVGSSLTKVGILSRLCGIRIFHQQTDRIKLTIPRAWSWYLVNP